MTAHTQRTLAAGRSRVAGAAATVLALAAATPAQALDPGVNYDPTSPAGKEYAIPLVEGRAEGAGTEDQQAAANTPFGEGIQPPGGRGPGARGDGGNGGNGGAPSGGAGGGGQAASPAARAEQRRQILVAEEPNGTAGATLWLAAAMLAAAVLAAGLLHGRRGSPVS